MLTTIQEIKKEFFAFRNGIVADALRKNGDPHEYIMGDLLSDITTIAGRITPSPIIATQLWNETKHRECRLIAPMLYPAKEMNEDIARQWACSVECNEVADVLCLKLLRALPFAFTLAQELINGKTVQEHYTGWRLMLNLVICNNVEDKDMVKQLVYKAKAGQPVREIAQLLISIEEEL